MTATAESLPGPDRPPFADASPAQVRTATGPERYRAVMASAEERLRTGERHPQAMPWSQLKAELGLPE
jgi:hypothetical protein